MASATAAPAPKMRAAPVVVAQAKATTLAPVTWVAGTVISRDDAKLATEVEGRLKKVLDGTTTIEECLRVVYIEGQEF